MKVDVQTLTPQSYYKVPTHLNLGRASAKLFHTSSIASPPNQCLPQTQTFHSTMYKGIVKEENKHLNAYTHFWNCLEKGM